VPYLSEVSTRISECNVLVIPFDVRLNKLESVTLITVASAVVLILLMSLNLSNN